MKPFAHAKSRLRGSARDIQEFPTPSELSSAFLCDVINAAQGAEGVLQVLVSSSDPAVEAATTRCNAKFFPERAPTIVAADPWTALNSAISDAVGFVFESTDAKRVAVVPADLACLRSDSLGSILRVAAGITGPSVVTDRNGSGTTMLMMARTHQIHSQFGPQSAAAHRQSGAVDLSATASVDVRLDVDTFDDLQEALALGLGTHCTELLRRHHERGQNPSPGFEGS